MKTNKLFRFLFLLLLVFLTCSVNENRYSDFSLNSFPPGSQPENGDWQYLLSIERTCEHSEYQFDYGPNKFEISIENKQNNTLFNKILILNLKDYRRNVLWNNADTIYLNIYNTTYNFDLHRDNDSVLVFSSRITRISQSINYQEDTIYYTQ